MRTLILMIFGTLVLNGQARPNDVMLRSSVSVVAPAKGSYRHRFIYGNKRYQFHRFNGEITVPFLILSNGQNIFQPFILEIAHATSPIIKLGFQSDGSLFMSAHDIELWKIQGPEISLMLNISGSSNSGSYYLDGWSLNLLRFSSYHYISLEGVKGSLSAYGNVLDKERKFLCSVAPGTNLEIKPIVGYIQKQPPQHYDFTAPLLIPPIQLARRFFLNN